MKVTRIKLPHNVQLR